MFQSERFFRESWPTISQAVELPEDAARSVHWIIGAAGLAPGTCVLDAPCGFGRHSVEFARRGFRVTGVDFNETEIERAREAATRAGVTLTLLCQDMRDMDFSGAFDLAVNLFSSIGYFSDDEDRLLLDRFWRALRPGGVFVLDTRNRDHFVRHLTPEETYRLPDGTTVRIKNTLDLRTSRVHGEWWVERDERPLGQTETRLYSAHELYRKLRPERWSAVELFGGLDGRPFELDSPRLVLVATK